MAVCGETFVNFAPVKDVLVGWCGVLVTCLLELSCGKKTTKYTATKGYLRNDPINLLSESWDLFFHCVAKLWYNLRP